MTTTCRPRRAMAAAMSLLAFGAVPALTVTGAAAAVAPHATTSGTKVMTRTGALGTYLTDGRGRTLYMFTKDTRTASMCTGSCASAWPPLLTRHAPDAGRHVEAAKLGTIRRPGGRRQVTYGGHPLYRYAFDSAPGQTNGEGSFAFGARWWLVAPSGRRIT